MFKCNDCGCEFETPEWSKEFHGLEYGYEINRYCPNCGSEDYIEGMPCDICGELAYGSDYCECCKDEAKKMLKIDFNHFGKAKMRDLIDLFNEVIDELYVEERSKK